MLRAASLFLLLSLSAATGCKSGSTTPPSADASHGDAATGDVSGVTTVLNMLVARNPELADLMDDLYWDPASQTEAYPATPTDRAFERRFVPACEDGTTPSDRTCTSGEPIRCTDGTRPVYYYRPGSNGRWIIHIQNGGVMCMVDYGDNYISAQTLNCWTAYTELDKAEAFSSIKAPPTRNYEGIYLPEASNLFNDYNLVVLDKCVGDRNMGAATIEDYEYRTGQHPNQLVHRGPVYFHGQRIVRAVVKDLAADPAAQPMDQVMFQAHSNGSMGLYLFIDSLADYVRSLAPNADVRGLAGVMVRSSLELEATADANGDTDYSTFYDNLGGFSDLAFTMKTDAASPANGLWASARTYEPDRLEGRRYTHWGALDVASGPAMDTSCLAAHGVDPTPCMDYMHVLMNHVSTPLFLTPSLYDNNVSTAALHTFTIDFDTQTDCDPGAACCHDANFEATADCSAFDDEPNFYAQPATYSRDGYAQRCHDTLRAMWELFRTESEMGSNCAGSTCDSSPLPSPMHGAFADDIASHDGMLDPSIMTAVIEGKQLQEYLKAWIEDDTEVFCVDTSGGNIHTRGAGAPWGICP